MPNNKTPLDWVTPLFAIAAILFGALVVADLVRGDRPQMLRVVLVVLLAVVAVGRWRMRSKSAD